MNDRKILSLLLSRQEAALQAMQQHYGRRLYLLALNILESPQDAEEAVNDTYLALWNAIPPACPEPLEGYALRTCRNIALNRLRYDRARKRNSRYDLCLDELYGALPEGDPDARELGRAINRFVQTLSGGDRRIFLRRYWFGDSVSELAHELGITANALSARLFRLRQKLRHHLIKEGFFHEP